MVSPLNFRVYSPLFCGERLPISHSHLSLCCLRIGFVYELHSLLLKRQRMLPLGISDTGQPGFFQRKQQGNKVWERKWHQREAIRPAPDEGKFNSVSEKRESRLSWKEQVSVGGQGKALIKMEVPDNQTANFPSFFPESSLLGVFPMAQSGCGYEERTEVRATKQENNPFCSLP